MYKSRIIVFILWTLFLGCSNDSTPPNSANLTFEFADKTVAFLKNGEIKETVELFHFVELEKDNLNIEKENIESSLNIIMLNFGEIIEFKRKNENNIKYVVGASSLDPTYWNGKGFVRVNYIFKTSEHEKVYLMVDVVNISKKLELKAITFGISMYEENSKEKIEDIFKQIFHFRGL